MYMHVDLHDCLCMPLWVGVGRGVPEKTLCTLRGAGGGNEVEFASNFHILLISEQFSGLNRGEKWGFCCKKNKHEKIHETIHFWFIFLASF
jgi:hypothetical protein